jgi:uncharacterized protein
MLFGVLADVHGNFEAMRLAMARHPDAPFWLCVGDLAGRAGGYPEPPAPLFWIKGNNEDFDQVSAMASGAVVIANLHYIPNGTSRRVGPITVAGLGGTYAPTWYRFRAADLPYPGHITPAAAATGRPVRNDKRRHFLREEVEALMRFTHVDVLMTHEAPRPFYVEAEPEEGGRPRRRDAGQTPINEVIAALRPRLHLCGHHHRYAENLYRGVPSVCVDRVSRSYLLVDADTFRWRKLDLPQAA